MKTTGLFRSLRLLLPLLAAATAHGATPPALITRQTADHRIEIVWPATAVTFVLEEAAVISAAPVWAPFAGTPQSVNGSLVATVDATGAERFFRLREVPAPTPTRIESTSPAAGETGVSVRREAILRFSAPLAADTLLGTQQFFAEFGGRVLLGRVELAGDGLTATLFHLEDLPASARIRVTFVGDGILGTHGKAVDADGDGQPGGTAVVDFDTGGITPVNSTAIIGKVFASEPAGPGANQPLAGVTITVDGAEETLRTTTDATGSFKLANCPTGRFFVHVDGRTTAGSSWPNGTYYPVVGKAWEAVAGRQDNLAAGTGEIFLPLIRAGTLQPVSATQDTVIQFPPEVVAANPALAGVQITVPANALYADNGVRGGKVGIAPVPPDRLPSPLPAGLQMPIVITVQTDGPLNFDRPAPVCFPNLPDPVTGAPLPAGSRQWLISFNHDKGEWEGVGSMTVSADGKLVCTDPGVGIRAPGR